MKVTVNECYELEGDYQNQFLGNEVFPRPKYKKVKAAERTVNKVHYDDVYILEPLHYYYVTFCEDIDGFDTLSINYYFSNNGLILTSTGRKKIFIFNASQNIIYLQKGTPIGEVSYHG